MIRSGWRSALSRRLVLAAAAVLIPVLAGCEAGNAAECTPRKIAYAGNESDLQWSPDSKRIAFVGRPAQFKNARLFVIGIFLAAQ